MIEQFENACRKRGLKLTHQRLKIYRELAASQDHPSAEALHRKIIKKMPTISLDTVYRTLATFEKHGLTTRIPTLESQGRYEANMEKHHPVVCRQCGAITDFKWNLFDEASVPKEIHGWGKVKRRNAVLDGICNECANIDPL